MQYAATENTFNNTYSRYATCIISQICDTQETQ